jgi:hypothetical protein
MKTREKTEAAKRKIIDLFIQNTEGHLLAKR